MLNDFETQPIIDQPMIFRIRVKGQLGPEWTDWFAGMTITPEDDGNTLLTGEVVDQAALHGLLKKVRDLGMPLVSVCPFEPCPWSTLGAGQAERSDAE